MFFFYEPSGGTNGYQAYIWDLWNTTPQDCKIVARQSRLRLPVFIYFLSGSVSQRVLFVGNSAKSLHLQALKKLLQPTLMGLGY